MTAKRLSTGANWPLFSPAATMLRYMSSKICGKCRRPSEKGMPLSMFSRSVRSTRLKPGCMHWSSRVETADRIDMPAFSMLAVCRVKGISSLLMILPTPLTRRVETLRVFSGMRGDLS